MRHWIPPGALIFAQASHGASWLLLAYVAARVGIAWSAPAMAWIHLVALGWFSMAALGILIHALPAFTDLEWSHERLARWALLPFSAGVVVFVAAWLVLPSGVIAGAAILVLALAGYLFAATSTLWEAGRAPARERAIGRALALTLWLFAVTAVLGTLMTLALAGIGTPSWLTRLPAIHADLGFYGWLSLLIFGVSVRTIRPISGGGSRFRWVHIAVGTLTLAAIAGLAIGLAIDMRSVALFGAMCLGLAVAAYVFDIADVLWHATVPHRPPQAFVAAALVWLVISSIIGGGVLLGAPQQSAFGFVLLIGWVGQMVNAHMFHIGVRLIATVQRGEDDETRPIELLDGRLSWLAFGGTQAAIALCAFGLVAFAPAPVTIGAIVGFLASCAIVGNLAVARSRSERPRLAT